MKHADQELINYLDTPMTDHERIIVDLTQANDLLERRIAQLERDAELGRLVRQAIAAKFSIELWRRSDGKGYVAVLGTCPAQGGDTLEDALRKALELVQPAKAVQP